MLQKSTSVKILEYFFKFPTKKHYLMDIARNIDVAHTSVKKCLEELKDENLIIESIDKRGEREFPIYTANFESRIFRQHKRISNLSQLYDCGLIKFISDKIMPRTIVLFGSYSRGEDIEDSDIDIFIESKPQELDMKQYETILGRKIELHFKKNFSEYGHELANNIANGIVLTGYLEVYKK